MILKIQLCNHRNKLHFEIYLNIFLIVKIFQNVTVFPVFWIK